MSDIPINDQGQEDDKPRKKTGKKVGKKQTRVRGGIDSPVCWTRYSGGGTPYVVCKTAAQVSAMELKASKRKAKALADYLPDISADQFLIKIQSTYSDLSQGQKRQYHKYKQRERRKKIGKLERTNATEVKSILRANKLDRRKEIRKALKEKAKRKMERDKKKANKIKDKEDKKKKLNQITKEYKSTTFGTMSNTGPGTLDMS